MKLNKIFAAIIAFVVISGTATRLPAQHQPRDVSPTSAAWRDDKPIVLSTDLVSLTVHVTDARGRNVYGLNQTAFTVFDNNVAQEIRYFSNDDAPASVAIVFDLSASMSAEKIRSAKAALAQFIHTSHGDDQYFLISFDSTAHLLVDDGRDAEALLKKFTAVQTQGETALYDAVYMGLEKLSQAVYAKRALIVISDGEDNHSLYSFNELRQRLQESDVTIYTVQIGIPLPRSNALQVMGELAAISGGTAFPPTGRDALVEIFERIALELRQQYALAFVPSATVADGKKRHIKITVAAPEGWPRVMVRHRKTYVAAKEFSVTGKLKALP